MTKKNHSVKKKTKVTLLDNLVNNYFLNNYTGSDYIIKTTNQEENKRRIRTMYF